MRVQGHDGNASGVHTPKLDSLARRRRRGCKEPSQNNGVLADGLRSSSGHVQALVKRGVGPFRDPEHRQQERVLSARRSGRSAVNPDKVGATSTDTKSTDFEYTIHHHQRRCSTGTSRSTPGSSSEASAIMSFFIMSLLHHHQSLSRFVACSVAVVRWCGFGGPG